MKAGSFGYLPFIFCIADFVSSLLFFGDADMISLQRHLGEEAAITPPQSMQKHSYKLQAE